MHHNDSELRQRVEQLARELIETRRDVARLRQYRRLSKAFALALSGVVFWSLSAPSMQAQATASPSKLVAPFTIVDDKGQELVSVTSAGGFARMRVGAQGGSVWLGTGASGTGFVTVQRQNNTDAVALGQIGNGPAGVRVMDGAGNASIAELTSAGGNGSLALIRSNGTRFLESMISGSGLPFLQIGDKGGVSLGAGRSAIGFVTTHRADKTDAVALGSLGGGAPGLRVFDASGEAVVAELTGDASGSTLLVGSAAGEKPTLKAGPKAAAADAFITLGRSGAGHAIRVADSKNNQLAVMGEAGVGGGVFVANDRNGTTRMLMSGQGELHAVDPTGVTRATVTSEGAVSVRNSGSATVAKLAVLGSGNGILQIANSGGNAMVEAGILPTSEGVVRTYPLGGPPATMIGMPGTFIKGFTGSGK